MEIRPLAPGDVDRLGDIDAVVENTRYLHLERAGEGMDVSWKLDHRDLREKKTEPFRIDHATTFLYKQVAAGTIDGVARVAVHDGVIVAATAAQHEPERELLRIADLRVDYDYRRQAIGTAIVYQLIQHAREIEVRAIAVETTTGNEVAARFFEKLGFEICGVDTHRHTNHDLVSENATLFWYAAFE